MTDESANQQTSSFFIDPFDESEGSAGVGGDSSPEQVTKKGYISSSFNVQTGAAIESLSTNFAKAYPVSATGAAKEVYAVVFDKGLPISDHVLKPLMSQEGSSIAKVLETGKIKVGNKEQYAAIVEKPGGSSVRELVKSGFKISNKALREQVIKPLNGSISELHETGYSFGNINADNVYFEPNSGTVFLREALSEFCGYSQGVGWESINRIICLPEAKGNKDPSADYFALGVLAFYMLTGIELTAEEEQDEEEIIEKRLMEGSLHVITGEVLSTSAINARGQQLIKGLLNDSDKDRWGFDEVDEWCRKKDKSGLPPSRIHKETATAFVFEGKEYFSRKHLAYDLQKNWNAAKASLNLEEVSRWVKLALKLPKVSDLMDGLENRSDESSLSDDKLARILNLLDGTGPLRFKEYTINIWGMGTFIANAFIEGKREYLQAISSLFSYGLIEQWINVQENTDDYSFSNLFWTPFKVAQNMSRVSLGFGMERCLYMLNPGLPCQGKVMADSCATGLSDLLLALDEMADNMKEKTDPVDRHVAAFIAQKIDLSDEIRVKSVQRHPTLARNPQISMLALLTVAQKEAQIVTLKGLTSWMKARVMPISEEFYNARIKREFLSSVDKASRGGSMNDMFKTVSNPSFINRDQAGFIEAKKQYRELEKQMQQLGKQSNIEKIAYQYGLRISVMFAYFVVIITLLLIVFRAA